MADAEDTETETMTQQDLLDKFFDQELHDLVCKYMQGKSVMVAYITLAYIIGASIGKTSLSGKEAQNALDVCGVVAANQAMLEHNENVDEPPPDVSKLQ